jgi:hypothetical protein
MLTRDERDQVIDDLADHVGLTSSIANVITIVFQGPDRTELGNFPLNINNVRDQAAWLVDGCLSSRWRLNPSLLELLLVRLTGQGGKGGLMPILQRVRTGVDPNPDPFNSLWVLASQPFLDRGPLRGTARQLVEDSSQPILRVNGPSRSGKTYTTELLSFVMEEARPDLHVVPVELAPETGPMFEVEELAEGLALMMEKRDPFPARSNSSYPKALVRWLISGAFANPGIWVFVLDGFGQPNLKLEVVEFIRVLAQHVAIPAYARRLRLVLLHFDQPLTGNWRAHTVDDGPLVLGGITATDLEDCLREFNTKMQALNRLNKMINPADIPTIAVRMFNNANKNPATQLPTLYEELWTIATS